MVMLFIGSKVNFGIKNLPMLAILLRRTNRVKMKNKIVVTDNSMKFQINERTLRTFPISGVLVKLVKKD